MQTPEIALIRAHTSVLCPPLLPELLIHAARDMTALWLATEQLAGRGPLSPPFWGVAWPGGQALARSILDDPGLVRGLRVLDFAAGCGVAGIAALRSGAAEVTATEIDPFAATAMRMNAALNEVVLETRLEDVVDQDEGWEVVLVGDIYYEQTLAMRLDGWLGRLSERGARVLVGDPGRRFLPERGLVECARYTVPLDLDLEGRSERVARVLERPSAR